MPYFFFSFLLTFVSFFSSGDCSNAADVHDFITSRINDTEALRANTAPSWVDAPYTRGTSNILLSCVVTMLACLYTAFHPNVLVAGGGKWSSIAWKVYIVMSAILAPEYMLSLATAQFREARNLKRSLEAYQHQPSFKYCFFVVMGGLQVSIADIYPSKDVRFRDLPPEVVSLSAHGVEELARLGQFEKIYVPDNVIDDKSKEGLLQKSIVFIQILWMAIQCIVRKAGGYPISTLEVYTFSHALCAIGVYVLWFQVCLTPLYSISQISYLFVRGS